ncbi:hypothetical protein BN1708_020627, partial [Verticillium longisporum]
EGPSTPRGQA